MTSNDVVGYWKITKMEVWGQDYVDSVVPRFIEFEMEDDHLLGQFQFGTVVGSLDCRLPDVVGNSQVEWSWGGDTAIATPVAGAVGLGSKTEHWWAESTSTVATTPRSRQSDESVR